MHVLVLVLLLLQRWLSRVWWCSWLNRLAEAVPRAAEDPANDVKLIKVERMMAGNS